MIMVPTLQQELRRAVRSLLRTPGFTLVAVLTMALAIGACTTVFSVLQAVVLRPLPFPDSGSLYNAWSVHPESRAESPNTTFTRYLAIREQRDVFAEVAVSAPMLLTYRHGKADPEMMLTRRISATLLPLLRVSAFRGRGFTLQEDSQAGAPVVMLSHSLWRSRFGADDKVIGQALLVDDIPREIVGVMPPEMSVAFRDAGLFVPRPTNMPTVPEVVMRNTPVYNVMIRLAAGVTPEAATARLNELVARERAANPGQLDASTYVLRPMKKDIVGDASYTFWTLAAAVGAVLLIACANVANLFLARISAAWRDVAVQLSLGASRGAVLRQFFHEAMAFSVPGAVLGAGIAWLGLRGVIALAGDLLPRAAEVRLDGTALAFCLGISLISALLVCLHPAWLATRIDVQSGLKETGRGAAASASGRVFREGLVVVQVGLSLVLLSCACLLASSLYRLLNADLGFATEARAIGFVNLPFGKYPTSDASKAFYRRLEAALEQAPELAGAGAASGIPLAGGGYRTMLNVVGQPAPPPERAPEMVMRWVTPGYFAAIGAKLKEGRFFTAADRAGAEQVAILNESLAKLMFPEGSAIDRRVGFGPGSDIRVAGVVRDVKTDIAGATANEVYVARDQMPILVPGMSVVARGRPGLAAEAIIPVIRRVLKEVDPDLALHRPRTMTALVDEAVQLRRLAMTLLLALAGIAAALATIGIYAVVAYTVAQRTPEIGVRMALGAQRSQIVRLILSQGVRLIVVGLGLGLLVVLWATRLLQSMLYQVEPLDPLILGSAVLFFTVIAVLACLIPSLRASRLDPVQALRAE